MTIKTRLNKLNEKMNKVDYPTLETIILELPLKPYEPAYPLIQVKPLFREILEDEKPLVR